jgi:methyl-accepting chemotaxis protein
MRTKKLIERGLQLRLVCWFASVAVVGLTLQFILLTATMSNLAPDLSTNPAERYEQISSAIQRILALSIVVVLPVSIVVGILTTFRIAGPIFRIRGFLLQLKRGDCPRDIVLRRGDALQDVAQLLNDVTAPLRAWVDEEQAIPNEHPRRAAS